METRTEMVTKELETYLSDHMAEAKGMSYCGVPILRLETKALLGALIKMAKDNKRDYELRQREAAMRLELHKAARLNL